ncbi:hypothetical protein [Actinokineospora cianjurensis]|uniref:Uncharacterized protein n=1 Tax=Actinokineospora cianjurensis TaxID=585224 RepID=A0A421B274_9PSEU|nr:hypothetical protein [Actinokineospora cianjurensis]RLK58396.1 hypothetical protein CLV68_4496 [Actinokineospora cianjurensis]
MAFNEPNSPYTNDPQQGGPPDVPPVAPLVPPAPYPQPVPAALPPRYLDSDPAPGQRVPWPEPSDEDESSWGAGIPLGLLLLAISSGLLWFEHGVALPETRAVLDFVLLGAWSPGRTGGGGTLRLVVVVITLIVFGVLTLVRFWFIRARARAEHEPGRPIAILCLTLARTFLITEAVAIFFHADRLNDPSEQGWLLFGTPIGRPPSGWTSFASTWLLWIIIAIVVVGMTLNSTARAIRRR